MILFYSNMAGSDCRLFIFGKMGVKTLAGYQAEFIEAAVYKYPAPPMNLGRWPIAARRAAGSFGPQSGVVELIEGAKPSFFVEKPGICW